MDIQQHQSDRPVLTEEMLEAGAVAAERVRHEVDAWTLASAVYTAMAALEPLRTNREASSCDLDLSLRESRTQTP
jgi:hypothetical protein